MVVDPRCRRDRPSQVKNRWQAWQAPDARTLGGAKKFDPICRDGLRLASIDFLKVTVPRKHTDMSNFLKKRLFRIYIYIGDELLPSYVGIISTMK